MATETKGTSLRRLKAVAEPGQKMSIKDRLMAPAGDGAFSAGRGLVAGGAVLGLGALCYYGLGLSNEVGAIDRAALWPEVVRERVRDTYMYFGGSLAATVASAVAVTRSPMLMNLMMRNSWVALFATIGAMVGTSMLCQSIPYQEGFGAKQLAWLLHSAVVGAVVAPITLLGGPIMLRAACYTAGVVGGLSMLAVCAPSDKFLYMGGPLAMGLGVVFISSIGTWFLPPASVLGAGMYSVAVYGGLALFGLFLLYDTQKIIHRAETHPTNAAQRYDPVNNSVGIYMDTINIFIRIAMILSGGGNRKK
jgi:FtsH-binding integral membrane protein